MEPKGDGNMDYSLEDVAYTVQDHKENEGINYSGIVTDEVNKDDICAKGINLEDEIVSDIVKLDNNFVENPREFIQNTIYDGRILVIFRDEEENEKSHYVFGGDFETGEPRQALTFQILGCVFSNCDFERNPETEIPLETQVKRSLK